SRGDASTPATGKAVQAGFSFAPRNISCPSRLVVPQPSGGSTMKTILSLAFALVAGTALAQSATESTGVNSALGVAPKTEDFILQASASDIFEIESSKLALTKGNE